MSASQDNGWHRVKVSSLNLHSGAPRGESFAKPGAFAAVRALGADLLGLQEVERRSIHSWLLDQSRLAARRSGLKYFRFSPTLRLKYGGDFGNVLASRWPISDFEQVWLPRRRSEPRCAQIATIQHPLGPITFVNTHLHNRPAIAARQLEAALSEVPNVSTPLVIVGDMNASSEVVLPLFDRFGLQAAESGSTFPDPNPTKRLDWIGVRGFEFSPRQADVSCGQSSDHCAISAHIVYN